MSTLNWWRCSVDVFWRVFEPTWGREHLAAAKSILPDRCMRALLAGSVLWKCRRQS